MLSPALETLAGLIRINSINPAYPGGKPEAGIATYVRQFFGERGIRTFDQEVYPDRPNVVAVLPGKSTRRIVLEAHVDTAAVVGMTIPPFEPNVSEGRMYGRGACDTKGGLAAMMQAVASLAKVRPACEVWMVAACDEEHTFRGVVRLCKDLPPTAAALVSEPTSMRCVVATKGVLRWTITCRGKAAHSSKPQLGRNAIVDMARVVLALEADAQRFETRRHPLLGSPTLNVGVIRGGVQINFVPDSCSIDIDRRLLPGEEPSDVLAEYRRLLDSLHVDAVMTPLLQDLPLETPADSPVVTTAGTVLKQLGLNPEPAGVPYGSDASKLSRAGVPSIVIGPGSIDQAHAAVEYVDCQQVDQAFEFYRQFILCFE